jgi:hypothetical protein
MFLTKNSDCFSKQHLSLYVQNEYGLQKMFTNTANLMDESEDILGRKGGTLLRNQPNSMVTKQGKEI